MSLVQCLIPVEVDEGWTRSPHECTSRKGLIFQPIGRTTIDTQWRYQVPVYSPAMSDTYYLSYELVKWLEANKLKPENIKLRFVKPQGTWIMSVPYDVSLMFKLTWGGL